MSNLRFQKAACLFEAGRTIRDVAEILDVSRSRACQLIDRGRAEVEAGETVFAASIGMDTPTGMLPLSRDIREALGAAGVSSFGELLAADVKILAPMLLRRSRFGRKQWSELERLIADWKALKSGEPVSIGSCRPKHSD